MSQTDLSTSAQLMLYADDMLLHITACGDLSRPRLFDLQSDIDIISQWTWGKLCVLDTSYIRNAGAS